MCRLQGIKLLALQHVQRKLVGLLVLETHDLVRVVVEPVWQLDEVLWYHRSSGRLRMWRRTADHRTLLLVWLNLRVVVVVVERLTITDLHTGGGFRKLRHLGGIIIVNVVAVANVASGWAWARLFVAGHEWRLHSTCCCGTVLRLRCSYFLLRS